MDFEESRIPPQAIELEQAVLGAILIDKNALVEIIDLLDVDCFYETKHRKLYKNAILPMWHNNDNIDLLTVTEKLRSVNLLNDDLSPYFVSSLTQKVSSSAHIHYHTLILKQFAIKRSLIRYSSEVLRAAYSNETDSLELLDSAARDLDNIGLQIAKAPFTKIDQVVTASLKEIEKVANSDEKSIIGVPCGFYDLDKITAGWQKSDLIILAARPGMGKTTLALNMVEFAAIQFGVKTAFFSLEMSKNQLGKRSISSQSGIDLNRLRTGSLNNKDWNLLHKKIAHLLEANIFIDDTGGLTIFEMKTKLRRLKHEHPDLGMVVVDYLQLINGRDPDNKAQNREQQISYISRSLKNIAKELDLPVIALSQLSRSVETRGGDKKPMLSDLRESGAIEADADLVTFLYRPEYYGITEDAAGNDITGQAQLIIAKHRNGRLDEVKLGFYGDKCQFVAIDEFYIHKRQQSGSNQFSNSNNGRSDNSD